jgi:hypothetical protein
MAKARSPEYPAISLGEAIDRVKMIYAKDYQNRVPKKVIAEHMGYKGISGASLPILSSLAKYGLLEGRGDETRVSDLAVALIAHPPGTPERMEALKQASILPELFDELDKRFPNGKASDQALRSYLLTQKFIPSAADAAIRAYRDTKELVGTESGGYVEPAIQEPEMKHNRLGMTPPGEELAAAMEVRRVLNPPPLPLMIQEVINLNEGPVTLTVPSSLSEESFEDLEAHFQLFLRRVKRRVAKSGNDEAAN